MARYCDNDQCEGNFHTTACTTTDPGLDMADETAMEDGNYRPARPATVIALPQPRQGGAAA